MTLPRFYVTYCTMDTETGANPLWHACLIFSIQRQEDGPVEVVDSYGFYAPNNTSTNWFVVGIKKHLLKLGVDLQGGLGDLRQEKMHYLDDNGLAGVSFPATEEAFTALWEHCQLEERLHVKHPFELRLNQHAHTCKTYALNQLREHGIIDDQMVARIKSSNTKQAIPRYSDIPLHRFRLVSTGPIKKIEKKGITFYSRTWPKAQEEPIQQNQLFWATSIHATINQTAYASTDSYHAIRTILTKLHHMELQLFKTMDKQNNPAQQADLETQTQLIEACYRQFKSTSTDDYLKLPQQIKAAEKTLRIAEATLNPDVLNYSFLLQAYLSVSMHYALLGLFCALTASFLLSGLIGATVITTSVLFSGHQLYGFYQKHKHHQQIGDDYRAFHAHHDALAQAREFYDIMPINSPGKPHATS